MNVCSCAPCRHGALAFGPASAIAAPARRTRRAVALRPRAQGLRRHGAQPTARRSGSRSPTACSATSTTRPRQHQHRDAAVRRHRRLDVHRPADARHDLHGPGARRPRADLPGHRDREERPLPDRHRLRHRPGRATRRHALALRGAARADASDYQLYVRFDPTLNGNGGGGDGNGGADDAARRHLHAATRCSSAPTPTTATNAANRDYAQPSTPRSTPTARFLAGLQRLRRHRQRRPRRSSTPARPLAADLRDAPHGNVVQTARARPRPRRRVHARARLRRRRRPTAVAHRRAARSATPLRRPQRVPAPGWHRYDARPAPRPRGRAASRRPTGDELLDDVLPERERTARPARTRPSPARSSPRSPRPWGQAVARRRPGEHLLRLLPRGLRAATSTRPGPGCGAGDARRRAT